MAEIRFASNLIVMKAITEQIPQNNFTVKLFKKEQPSAQSFPILTEVVGLSLFQMPAIYHHLHEGDELSLYYNYNAVNPMQAVEIFYKKFKLGYLHNSTAELVEKVMMHGFDLKVKVSGIVKRKYMPISHLFIHINENYL